MNMPQALSGFHSLLRHPGLVQPFEHVRVIFRPNPQRPQTFAATMRLILALA